MTTHPATPDQSNPVGKTPEALRLAEALADYAKALPAYGFTTKPLDEAAAELRRLHALSGHPSHTTRNMDSTAGVPDADLTALFREALAWGMAYGPAIPAHQWDEMRDSQAAALALRARGAVPSGWKLVPVERSYDQRAKALTAFNTTEAKKGCDRDDALQAAWEVMLAAAPAAPGSGVEQDAAPDREALVEVIAQGLSGTWHCTRVWEAWHVGTMSQDDFEPVDESETPGKLADAVIAFLATKGKEGGA